MPFTPFHLGPSLAARIGFKRAFHIPAFLLGSVLLDLEPLTVLLLHLDRPLHGFFHTLIGGLLVTLPISLLLFVLRKPLAWFFSALKLSQSQSSSSYLVPSRAHLFTYLSIPSSMPNSCPSFRSCIIRFTDCLRVIISTESVFYPLLWQVSSMV
jgi:hypothetical protein